MNAQTLRASAGVAPDGLHPGWPLPDGRMAPSLEECELLYSLVRAVKPTLVYESGTGLGYSAAFIASALDDNGHGTLLTYEPSKGLREQAAQRLGGLPVEFTESPVNNMDADLVYLDSEPGLRPTEIGYWLGGQYDGLVIVHDAERNYRQFQQGNGVIVPTAYGMWIGRAK